MSEPAGSKGYDRDAAALAKQYESITFADVHRDVMHLFPGRPSRILDIGAGSGRDAAALARLGHFVSATEPTAELRRQAQTIHAGLGIEGLDDALPELERIRQRRPLFDVILLTAVWMHLDEGERRRAMRHVAELLPPSGKIVLSLRHGTVPPGRRMFDVSAEETTELGRQHGLTEIHRSDREDMLGREAVWWSFLGLQSSIAP